MNPVQQSLAALGEKLVEIEKKIADTASEFQASMMDVGSSIGSVEKMEDDLFTVRESVEQIQGELVKAHKWLEDLRTLEKVVTGLIGPDKLRSLIEKERAASRSEPPPPSQQKKSIL